jgi:hypothetical protein
MNQSEINAEIDQYLHLVRKKLSMLTDAEAIVSELRTHIWESANKFASKDGLPIEQAFRKALDLMEDPEVLANRFYAESGYEYVTPNTSEIPVSPNTSSTNSSFSQNFQQKSHVPERKLDQDKFFIIAILGFIATMIIGGTFVTTFNDPAISFLGSLLQIGAFFAFISFLYYRDDQNFKEQLAILREKFEKEINKSKSKHRINKLKKQYSMPSRSQAFFAHLGGVISFVFILVFMLFITFVTYFYSLPFFNDYWYSIGIVCFYISIGSQLIFQAIKAFVGQVRGLRLLESVTNIISAITTFVLIIYYPFNFGPGAIEYFGSAITNPDVVFMLSNNFDYYIRIFMGFTIVINVMKAIYSVFKFETWKAKDTKSLLNM